MSENMIVRLDDRSGSIVRESLGTGRYRSAEEVVRAGLSLLEEHERRTRALRDALLEGERSGPPEDFDFDAFVGRRKRDTVEAE